MTKLLSTAQMARFVTDGFIRLDEVIPKDLCKAVLNEFEEHSLPMSWPDSYEICTHSFNDIWKDTATKQIFELDQVKGMVESLVGPDPLFDHHFVHTVGAESKSGANLHQDSVLDIREDTFDIQISVFVQDITPEMGGTLFLPGSHFHRPRLHALGRYHHVKGQQQTVCKAGTVVAWHHNLWHSARSNYSNETRYMLKVRLNPQVKQQLLWDCSDVERYNPYGDLTYNHGWQGIDLRTVYIQRAKMWQHLTDNPNFDIIGLWHKIRNEPQTRACLHAS